MEILHRGKPPADKPYRFECRACETKIKAVQSEGRIVHDHRDGDAVVFVCPVCSLDVWVAK